MKWRWIVLVFTFVMLFSSCHINEELHKSCKVVKIVDQEGVNTFQYVDNDLITEAVLNSSKLKIKFFYDENNRISKTEYYDLTSDSLFEYSQYTWEDLNTIHAIIYANEDGTFKPVRKVTYLMNENNDPVKRTYYVMDENGAWKLDGYKKYFWYLGDIQRIEYYKKKENEEGYSNPKTLMYEYDDKQNPWRNVSVREVNENEDVFMPSANNPVKITEVFNTTGQKNISTLDYQYNPDDLPVSYTVTTIDFNGNETTHKVSEIEYNCQ